MPLHLIDVDEEAFASLVTYFSESTGDHRAISSLREAKVLRDGLEIEDPGPGRRLPGGRAEATG